MSPYATDANERVSQHVRGAASSSELHSEWGKNAATSTTASQLRATGIGGSAAAEETSAMPGRL